MPTTLSGKCGITPPLAAISTSFPSIETREPSEANLAFAPFTVSHSGATPLMPEALKTALSPSRTSSEPDAYVNVTSAVTPCSILRTPAPATVSDGSAEAEATVRTPPSSVQPPDDELDPESIHSPEPLLRIFGLYSAAMSPERIAGCAVSFESRSVVPLFSADTPPDISRVPVPTCSMRPMPPISLMERSVVSPAPA